MNIMYRIILIATMLLTVGCGAPESSGPASSVADLHFNQVQYIGTHNAYHIAPESVVGTLITQEGYQLSDMSTDQLIKFVDYTHLPLEDQLQLGIRHFEIDVYPDPEGDRFSRPGIFHALESAGLQSELDYDPEGVLAKPGFKAIHIADVDMRSTCLLFKDCLSQIKKWSGQNPGHLPVIVQVEVKETGWPALNDAYTPVDHYAFTDKEWRDLEEEILSILPREKVITPKDVQGEYANLNQAITEGGWPLLSEMQGKIIFMLDNGGSTLESYLAASKRPEGPLAFVSVEPGHPLAAWIKMNDPFDDRIPALVAEGYLIRTRADASTIESRTNDRGPMEKAFSTGAHFISTDYPIPDRRFSDFQVIFENQRYVRCNVLTFKGKCPFLPKSVE